MKKSCSLNFRTSISAFFLILIIVSLCFSRRLSTLFVFLYAISLMLEKDFLKNVLKAVQEKWVIPFLVLFILHCCSLLWTENIHTGWYVIEKKASLLAIPLLIAADKNISPRLIQEILEWFIWGCCGALFVSLVYAFINYLQFGNTAVFFYHDLGYLLDKYNALYFSFLLFLALIFLNYLGKQEKHLFHRSPIIRRSIVAFLCLGILLLSSKAFILLTAIFFLMSFFREMKSKNRAANYKYHWIIGFCVFLFGLALLKPTQDRFKELLSSQFEVLQLDRFRYDTPFNALTIRLLLIKFGWEILDRHDAFIQGVGVGDAQDEMDDTIIAYNLYHGNPSLNDTGYLGYNPHNQFMEFWVQIGVFGPLIWMYILGMGLYFSRHTDVNHPLIYLVLALFIFSFAESFLERQRGVLPCTYFLSLFIKTIKSDIENHELIK